MADSPLPRWEQYRCACAFGKAVDDKNPDHFPRVGMADNVVLRGHWIIRHKLSERQAVIIRPGAGTLHAEADKCCYDWFDSTLSRHNAAIDKAEGGE